MGVGAGLKVGVDDVSVAVGVGCLAGLKGLLSDVDEGIYEADLRMGGVCGEVSYGSAVKVFLGCTQGAFNNGALV